MTKQLRILAAIGLLVGCAPRADEPAFLVGSWANSSWEITAASHGLALYNGCSIVTFPGPVVVTSTDSFAITGTVTAATNAGPLGQRWRVSGRAVGDTLSASFSYLVPGTTGTWIPPYMQKLVKGYEGTFYGFPCLE
jgi:hypothetical protein